MLRNIGIVLVLVCVGVACHGGVGPDSALVGGSCRDDFDCEERCVEGKDYPGGTCTVECRDDRDCPGDSWCVDKSGGVCLMGCDYDEDCRGGYDCRDVDREGAGGKIPVCFGD
ncbi:hypothetical protein [Paraliomyxa miuraensis]|uniref:hypothetical protein n=1 Tax=Paraliomyxa miuraensis TaxID=376150 RepID=UPI0022589538|nr:hypothetical protein [Paraliomyxa miuraensis]MCX4246524.1 hypothetical protein [Paraliomyxa miuraensis]